MQLNFRKFHATEDTKVFHDLVMFIILRVNIVFNVIHFNDYQLIIVYFQNKDTIIKEFSIKIYSMIC